MLVDVRFGLVKLVLSTASIVTLIDDRIYPTNLRQGETRPSIVYSRITEAEQYTMVGPSGLVSARYQFDAWSLSTDSATLVANLVKELFGGFHGRIAFDPPAPDNYVDVQLIEIVNGRDDFDSQSRMFRVSKDYFVWYEERNG